MMYIKQTIKYMGRSFWVLALVNVLTAVTLAFFTKPMISLAYFAEYASTDIKSFIDIFWLIFNQTATKNVFPLFIIFIMMFVSCCFSLSIIEKHFRLGKLKFKEPFKQINYYFFPIIVTLLLLSAIILLYGLVQAGAVALLHFMISGAGAPNLLNIMLSTIISVGLFVFALFLACSAMYWTPLMMIYGYTFTDACTASVKLVAKKTGSILVGLAFPFLSVAVLESIVLLVNTVAWAAIIINTVLYLFLIVYVVSFIMVSFYDLTGLERRDCKKPYELNKGE